MEYESVSRPHRERPDEVVNPIDTMVAPGALPTIGGAGISAGRSDVPDARTAGASATPTRDEHGCHTGSRIRYFGDYVLIDVLGRGAMGVVYHARQISLDRPVAVKMIRAAALAEEDDRRRFQNEAEAAAKLDHPHIVPVYEVGEHDGERYYSMKLIDGPCLHEALPAYATNPKRAARLMATIAGAVHHAHQRGILHRDLKPSNILLDEVGQPHVSDFGLAKRVEGDAGLTVSGVVVGTPAYMAPEQASGNKRLVTTLTDVYGLGAILYTLLTSRPPFTGNTALETLDHVRHQAPSAPSRTNRKTPRDLEVICLKCLAKDPSRRYASAQALADDLERFLAGTPIQARPTSALERSWLWCRRNPWLAGACGATVAALVAVSIYAVLYARQQSKIAIREKQIADEQKKATEETQSLAMNLESSLKESHRNLAGLYFERGQSACERGETGLGLTWLAQSYRWAIEAGDKHWRHLALASLSAWQRHHAAPLAMFSYTSSVMSVAVSPDGKRVLIAGWDKKTQLHSAQLWEISTGRPVGQPLRHQGPIAHVAISRDAKTMLTGSWDSTARLWDASTAQPVGVPMRHANRLVDVAFSPDGKSVLTGSEDGTARLWDVRNGAPLRPPMKHNRPVRAVALSPDGKTVLTGSADKTARLWSATNGQPIGRPMLHEKQVAKVAFSADGKTVLTSELLCDAVRLWDAVTGEPVGTPLAHIGRNMGVAFSPDGKIVVTGSWDGTARFWDSCSGQALGLPITHQDWLWPIAFSPDGKFLLMAIGNRSAQLWDVATRLPVGVRLTYQSLGGPRGFSPDGKIMITADVVGTTWLWGVGTGAQLSRTLPHLEWVLAVAFSPDAKTVLTASHDKTARIWDAATGRPLGPPLAHESDVKAVAFSPDGKIAVTGSDDKTARLWDAASGRSIGLPLSHPRAVCAVAFSPDGKTVVTGCDDKSARFWNVSTGQQFGSPMFHDESVSAVAFSPDGKTILTGSRGWKAWLWEASTGQPIGVPLDHDRQVSSVAFSPDGKTVLTGCHDNAARVWDASTGQPLGPTFSHQDLVSAVAFSPDGTTVLTASHDKTARLWDSLTGHPLGPPMRHRDWVYAAAFSPDGNTVLTGCRDHTAQLWDVSKLPDDPEQIATWVEVVTGLGLDRQGAIKVLDSSTWRLRRNQLESCGGLRSVRDRDSSITPHVDPGALSDAFSTRFKVQ